MIAMKELGNFVCGLLEVFKDQDKLRVDTVYSVMKHAALIDKDLEIILVRILPTL